MFCKAKFIFLVSVAYCLILIRNAQANLTTAILKNTSFYELNMTSIFTNSTEITKTINTTINASTASTLIKNPTVSSVLIPTTSISTTIMPTTVIFTTTSYLTGYTMIILTLFIKYSIF